MDEARIPEVEVAEVGIPAKVVSERLGHANIAITMDTDSQVLPAWTSSRPAPSPA